MAPFSADKIENTSLVTSALYPNPVKAGANITAHLAEGEETLDTIEWLDLLGKILVREALTENIGTLVVPELKKGNYIVKLYYNHKVSVQKIVIE